jgi:hypothetical protein
MVAVRDWGERIMRNYSLKDTPPGMMRKFWR